LRIRGGPPRHKSATVSRRDLDTTRPGYTMVRMEATLNGRLAMIRLPDSEGREVRLGSLWLRQPAVIVFLRHYG